MKNTKNRKIEIRVDSDTVKKLNELQNINNTSNRSNLIRSMIEKEFDNAFGENQRTGCVQMDFSKQVQVNHASS